MYDDAGGSGAGGHRDDDEVQVRVEGHFGLLAGRNMSSEGRSSY